MVDHAETLLVSNFMYRKTFKYKNRSDLPSTYTDGQFDNLTKTAIYKKSKHHKKHNCKWGGKNDSGKIRSWKNY